MSPQITADSLQNGHARACFFVTRREKNAKSEVIETLYACSSEDSEAGKKACVPKEEHIHLISHSDLYWVVTRRDGGRMPDGQ
jgi:hypothetical protein